MYTEDQIRKVVHLIVDRTMDTLIHTITNAVVPNTNQPQGNTNSPTTLKEEEPMNYKQKTRQQVIPNDLQSEKAKRSLARLGWRA